MEPWHNSIRDADGVNEFSHYRSSAQELIDILVIPVQRPFEADNMSDMYDRIFKDELQFPEDQLIDRYTKDFIEGVSCCLVLTQRR